MFRSSLPQRPKRSLPPNFERRDSTDSETEIDADSDTAPGTNERPTKIPRRALSHVEVTQPAYPRSVHEGWEPPLQRSRESAALSDLKTAFEAAYGNADDPPYYTYFTLNDFTIYNPLDSRHSHEMVTLDRLQNRGGCNEFLFDGVLSVGEQNHFVQGVRFQIMAVDGYGEADVVGLRDRICIQSPIGQANEVWYQLGTPSSVYERFYTPFLWLTQFTKFFVDYLIETKEVTLHHFRSRFAQWLKDRYPARGELKQWLERCNHLNDFRTTVSAHYGYLWKECFSIDDRKTGLCKHPIWGEVNPFALSAIPERPNHEEKTIVTPFVYNCFKRMYFHEHMEMRKIKDDTILKAVAEKKKALGLTPFGASQAPEACIPTPQSFHHASNDTIDVMVGDVVCVPPEIDGAWRLTCTTWFAYVQNVRRETYGTMLDVIWLYEPHDTTFGRAYYPFKNELFMSDNCGCGREAVNLTEVIGKANVTFFAKDPSQHSGLFVRQKFRTIRDEDTYDFVTLQRSDFQCRCSAQVPMFEACRRNFKPGDAVLVRQWNPDLKEDSLEPSQIIDFDLDKQRVCLRRLLRKQEFDENAAPNQLVLSDETITKPPSAIIRKCHVQFFVWDEVQRGLPTPYDRRGAGDFFYIVRKRPSDTAAPPAGQTEGGDTDNDYEIVNVEAMDNADIESQTEEINHGGIGFPPLEPGLDLNAPNSCPKLKGMGIFCGGGNFDRGLEDGGAVEFRYAVDWASRAIHSYRANVHDPENVKFFLGSVNDYLAQAIAGSRYHYIARIGDVEFLGGGSPCPGFSNMQLNKQSPQSLRNASMVASVVSYVDFYCPKYCILENVVSMTAGHGANKDENVFAQILAALVAMGYQTQQFLMDAWNHGSSQSRSRIFIIASAPGLEPLSHPQHTHAHPSSVTSERALGTSSNGLTFGVRRFDYTPFQHVSPAQATNDLPHIGDSQPQLCPTFPDHRTPSEEGAESRGRIASVPVRPHGMGLAQAALQGRVSGAPLEWFERQGLMKKAPGSRTYSRVVPDGLFRTVTTALNIQCAFSGSTLHWNQDRSLTVMELKRAQGFLDEDVIIGTPRDQVHIIGNSVERNVALALGLSLRRSWTNSNRVDETSPVSESSDESWQSVVNSQPTHRDGDGDELQGRLDGVILSQQERQEILGDPAHGFRTIGRIVTKRANAI
jgi:DNA (cytosine-5)-methyltransferase 1